MAEQQPPETEQGNNGTSTVPNFTNNVTGTENDVPNPSVADGRGEISSADAGAGAKGVAIPASGENPATETTGVAAKDNIPAVVVGVEGAREIPSLGSISASAEAEEICSSGDLRQSCAWWHTAYRCLGSLTPMYICR